ncbi:MAG: hypothetical protein IJ187_11530 [Neisseriaceae bacterium]|nr:hypothetical protein [Neisseriaceae bacterium]MBQ9260460.1 hypothetical protein [Neisseriaceae bacterium]
MIELIFRLPENLNQTAWAINCPLYAGFNILFQQALRGQMPATLDFIRLVQNYFRRLPRCALCTACNDEIAFRQPKRSLIHSLPQSEHH